MLKLLLNGDVYDPEPVGRSSVLIADGRIAHVGDIDTAALRRLGADHEIVDVSGCVVVPGFIDPHQHLLGGSGEAGFSTQTPELFLSEIVAHGITTVVGVLGVDTTMKTMAGLLAKAKGLKESGIGAYVWSGGYDVPPKSILGSIRDDILFIDEVIGAGEIAISDDRALDPTPHELARVLTDSYVGGMLSRKSCRTHFHVGDRPSRLRLLFAVLDTHDVRPEWMYVTHIERNEDLMREGIRLARRGAAVDIDTVEQDLSRWARFYRENDGPPEHLTVSSDAAENSPRVLSDQIRVCVREGGFTLEEVLPWVTSNTARILGLKQKGRLRRECAADLVVMEKGSLEILHVMAGGQWMVRNGSLTGREAFLNGIAREIHLVGRR